MSRLARMLLVVASTVLAGCVAPAADEPVPEPGPQTSVDDARDDLPETQPVPPSLPRPPKEDVVGWWNDEGCGLTTDVANVTIVPGTRVTVNATFRNCSSGEVEVRRSACDSGLHARFEAANRTWALPRNGSVAIEGGPACIALDVPPIRVPSNGTHGQAFTWDGTAELFECGANFSCVTSHVVLPPRDYALVLSAEAYAPGARTAHTVGAALLPSEDGLSVLSRRGWAADWYYGVSPAEVRRPVGSEVEFTVHFTPRDLSGEAVWANVTAPPGGSFEDGSDRVAVPPEGAMIRVRMPLDGSDDARLRLDVHAWPGAGGAPRSWTIWGSRLPTTDG